MIRNNLKIAWRNLIENKVFSFINIAGLAIGLACFTLIALYVIDEFNFDRFNEKVSRIYRGDSEIKFGGTQESLAVCSNPMGGLAAIVISFITVRLQAIKAAVANPVTSLRTE